MTFHRSRVAILVVYALMMVIISLTVAKDPPGKKLVKPITSCSTLSLPYEPMGIVNTSSTSRYFTWYQESCSDEELIDHSSIIQLVQQSVHQYQLMTQINNHSSTAAELFSTVRLFPFYPQQMRELCILSDYNKC